MSERDLDTALSALSRSGWRDPAGAAGPFGNDVRELVQVAARVREGLAAGLSLSAEASARHLQLIARVATDADTSRCGLCRPFGLERSAAGRWGRTATALRLHE